MRFPWQRRPSEAQTDIEEDRVEHEDAMDHAEQALKDHREKNGRMYRLLADYAEADAEREATD